MNRNRLARDSFKHALDAAENNERRVRVTGTAPAISCWALIALHVKHK
jgi:hypothetical protein